MRVSKKESELSVQSVGIESNSDGMRSITSVGSEKGISSRSEKNNYKLVTKLTSVGDKSNICCSK